jgi:multiple sugar transport system substrate-binding protein
MSSRFASRMSRRGLLGALGVVGGAVALAACGGSAPPTEAPKAAGGSSAPPSGGGAAPAAAPTNTPAPAAAGAAAPAGGGAPPPTPTFVPTATPVPYTGGDKVLLRVHWSGIQFNDFAKLINEYNSTQGPKDKIYVALERQLQAQAGGGLVATFIADFQAGTSEDIYHLNDAYLPDLAVRNFFMEAPQEVAAAVKKDWWAGTFETGSWEGRFYGYPTENQTLCLIINKKLFEDGTGLTLPKDEPKTWDDLRKTAKATMKKDASGKTTRQGFIWRTDSNEGQTVQRVVLHATMGEEFVEGWKSGKIPKVNYLSDVGTKIINLFKAMADDGSAVAGLGPESNLQANRLGTMVLHESYSIYFNYKSLGDANLVGEQYAVVPFSEDGKKKASNTRNYHYEVSSKSKVKDQAWKFLKWMNEGPEFRMANFQVNTFGFVPSVKSVNLPSWWPAQLQEAWKDALTNTVPMPNARGLARIEEILARYQNAVMLGKQDPKSAMQQADQETKQALEEAYR